MKTRSREIGCCNNCVALKFDRHLGNVAAELRVKFQGNWKTLNPNLAPSRLDGILRSDARWIGEYRSMVIRDMESYICRRILFYVGQYIYFEVNWIEFNIWPVSNIFVIVFVTFSVSDIFIAPICGKQFTFLQREQCKLQFSISPSYFRLFQLYYLCIGYGNPRLSYLVFWNSIINRKPFKIELFTWFFFHLMIYFVIGVRPIFSPNNIIEGYPWGHNRVHHFEN